MSKPLVFISHSSSDSDYASSLAAELRSRGLSVWIDHERIRFGESIPQAISVGLSHSSCILAVVSHAFAASKWCRAEYEPLLVREIEQGGILVVPVIKDDCPVPTLLSAKRFVDLRGNAKENARKLDELAQQIIESHATPTSTTTETDTKSFWVASQIECLTNENSLERLETYATRADNVDTAVELLETVSDLVGKFEDYVDDINAAVNESRIAEELYGSAYTIPREKKEKINRKLITVSNEMRSIYRRLKTRFRLEEGIEQVVDQVTRICAQISVVEDILVIRLIDNPECLEFMPEVVDSTAVMATKWGWLPPESLSRADKLPSPKDLPDYLTPAKPWLEDTNLALIQMHNFRIALSEIVQDFRDGRKNIGKTV
jgi:hypothetical protein